MSGIRSIRSILESLEDGNAGGGRQEASGVDIYSAATSRVGQNKAKATQVMRGARRKGEGWQRFQRQMNERLARA